MRCAVWLLVICCVLTFDGGSAHPGQETARWQKLAGHEADLEERSTARSTSAESACVPAVADHTVAGSGVEDIKRSKLNLKKNLQYSQYTDASRLRPFLLGIVAAL